MSLSLSSLSSSATSAISTVWSNMETKMSNLTGDASPEELMQLQFELAKFNVVANGWSSVAKEICDVMKSVVQKFG